MKRLTRTVLVVILAATAGLVTNVAASAAATWQPLGSLSTGAGPVDQPQVAVDAGGNSVFVWQRLDATTDCSGAPCLRIQARSRTATGVLSPIQTLSAAGRHSSLPQVAVDANGNAVFVWQSSDGANLRIQTRARSAAGALGGTHTISAAGESAEYPQLAIDATGNTVFVWERWDGAAERIQARTRWANDTLGATQTLSAAGMDAIYPQVDVDPNGHAVVAWEIYDGTHERIQARPRSADGTRGTTLTLSTAGQDAASAQVAVDPNGNAVVGWIGSDGTVQRMQARVRSAAGTLSATQILSDPGKNAFEPRVAVAANGNAVFLWQRFDGIENRVQTRARSAAGIVSPTQTLGSTGTTIPMGAQLAVDRQGNAVVVWEHREGTAVCCLRVEARVRAADSTLGSTQILSNAGEDAHDPHVAVNPNGAAFAVWGEATTGKVQGSVKS